MACTLHYRQFIKAPLRQTIQSYQEPDSPRAGLGFSLFLCERRSTSFNARAYSVVHPPCYFPHRRSSAPWTRRARTVTLPPSPRLSVRPLFLSSPISASLFIPPFLSSPCVPSSARPSFTFYLCIPLALPALLSLHFYIPLSVYPLTL